MSELEKCAPSVVNNGEDGEGRKSHEQKYYLPQGPTRMGDKMKFRLRPIVKPYKCSLNPHGLRTATASSSVSLNQRTFVLKDSY